MLVDVYSDALKQARERTLEPLKLLSIVGQLNANGQAQLVAALYQTWLDHNADSPLAHAIYFNYGVVLTGLGDNQKSIDAFRASVGIKEDFFPSHVNLGSALDRVGRAGDAVQQWQQIVNRLPVLTGENLSYKTSAYKQIGRVLERHNFDEHAEDALRNGLDLDPSQWDVAQHWLSLRQRQCKWPVVKPWGRVERTQLLNGFSALSLAAYTDDPLLLLGNAYKYTRTNIGKPAKDYMDQVRARRQQPRGGRLKIGYLSSDLREHAIGFLTAEIYGLHDRSKVETFVYYCGIKANDKTFHRIKESSEHWLDVNDIPDEPLAEQIFNDGIEILIDVNGYTNGARTKMLAMRPAPIIVNWLGFPGTMASPYHHYIIADDFVIPQGSEIYYSEKVVRVPCYQANDRHRAVAPTLATRQEAGLPEDAMVYCCFNGLHKITQFTWQRWMTILHQTPNSVLWLLDGVESTTNRLRQLFAEAGLAPERLIFAKKKNNAEHLARYPLADLFLDSSPYGAHTTSSDALWMGVPVVTYPGRSFASRVCGSLLTAAGLSELICNSPDEFVSLAISLGKDREKLLSYRRRLTENRDTCVLFDTPRLVKSLEDLYAEMWRDYESGNLPIPDLHNLDIYNEIGCEMDQDDVELQTVSDYHQRYELKLAEKDDFWGVPLDARLWTAETRNRYRKK